VKADSWFLATIVIERFVTRLFTEKLGWLPDWANFLDYPMLVLFAAYVLRRIRGRRGASKETGFGLLASFLIINIGISMLVNLDRLHPGAASLFIMGLLEPLAFMALAYRLNPHREVVGALAKVLVFVGWLQIVVVGIMDVPTFLVTRNPDLISGTFGKNAYQLTFFLLTWNALVLSDKAETRQRALRQVSILMIQAAIVVIILLAQFRSFLPFTAVTWIVTYIVVNQRPMRGFVAAAFGGSLLVGLFVAVNGLFPELKWGEVFELADRTDEVYESGKFQAVLNFGHLIADQPGVLAVGTGPGTYASRGFRTFSIAGEGDVVNRIYRDLFNSDYYVTDVAARYTLPVERYFAFGAATTAVPWFSYLAIPAELGLPGLAIVLAIYGKAIVVSWNASRKAIWTRPLAQWVLIGLVLLLQMAFLENWLEVSRLTVPVWLVFGVVLAQVQTKE